MERRGYRRIPARLGLTVKVLGPGSETLGLSETALTENISPGDLFFFSALHDRMSIGAEVDMEIDLPVHSPSLFGGKHLQVRGRVVRLAAPQPDEPERRGVAVSFLNTPRFVTDLD